MIIRDHLSLNQTKFAQKIGVTSQLINKIESKKAKLTEANIHLICLTFGVREEWLREGKGEMFNPPLPEPPAPVIIDGRKLEPDEKELLDIYDKLIPETQKEVRNYANDKLELQELREKAGGEAQKQAPEGTTRPLEAPQEAKGEERAEEGVNPIHNKNRG
jgi:transcriptional regulator with XRE-family HTH domain